MVCGPRSFEHLQWKITDRNWEARDTSRRSEHAYSGTINYWILYWWFYKAAIPKILSIPVSWHDEQNNKLEEAADLFYDGIKQAPGLIPIMPSGSMYMMVKIDFSRLDNFSDDMHFCQALVSEKSVFVLPGSCFFYADSFRVVLTIPKVIEFLAFSLTFVGKNSRSLSTNRRLLQW